MSSCFSTPPGEQNWSFSRANHITQNPLHKFVLPPVGAFDIWHATYQNTHYMPMRNRRIKVVLSITIWIYVRWKKSPPKSKVPALPYRTYWPGDAIVCILSLVKRDVLTHYNVRNKPLTVIRNGTNMLDKPTLGSRLTNKTFSFFPSVLLTGKIIVLLRLY